MLNEGGGSRRRRYCMQTGCRDGKIYDDGDDIPAIWPWEWILGVILNQDKSTRPLPVSVAGTIHNHFHYPLNVAKRAKTFSYFPRHSPTPLVESATGPPSTTSPDFQFPFPSFFSTTSNELFSALIDTPRTNNKQQTTSNTITLIHITQNV